LSGLRQSKEPDMQMIEHPVAIELSPTLHPPCVQSPGKLALQGFFGAMQEIFILLKIILIKKYNTFAFFQQQKISIF